MSSIRPAIKDGCAAIAGSITTPSCIPAAIWNDKTVDYRQPHRVV